jgi:hypothetical protein
MIKPYLSFIVGLSILPTSLHLTNIQSTTANNKVVPIVKEISLDTKKLGISTYALSIDNYNDYTKPAVETVKRMEEEARLAKEKEEAEKAAEEARLKAEEEARQRELEAQRIAAQNAAKAKAAAVAKAAAPAPMPAHVETPHVSGSSYESLIAERCNLLGCDTAKVIRVMYCESGGRPSAYNKSSGASGLFQQMPQYWDGRAIAAGVAGASIWDPYAQIIVATNMFSRGQAGHWVCK